MKTWFRVTLYRYGVRNKECIEDKEDNSVLQSYFLYLPFPRITSYLRKISGKMGQFVRLRSQLPILGQAPSGKNETGHHV